MNYKTFSPNIIKSYRVTDINDISAKDNETIQDWICPICNHLVFEPKICDSCNKPFCNECIQQFMRECNNKYSCIYKCRNTNLRDMKLYEKKFINKIKLKCKHDGCNKFINYTDYKNHLENCLYRLYHCDNNPCIQQGFLEQMEKHSRDCKYRIVFCKECKMKFKYIDKDDHFDNICPQQKVNCPFCDIEIKRVDYLNHHQSKDANCLKKIINIKNNKLNEYEAEIKRLNNIICDLNVTLQDNKNLIKKQNDEIDELKKVKNSLIENDNDQRKRIKELRQYFKNCFNLFNEINNEDDKVLNINNEINKKENQNNYQNTQPNFNTKKEKNGGNIVRNKYNCLTERRDYNRNMRRNNSEANFY